MYVWFILVDEVEKTIDKPIVDGYGNIVAPGQPFLSGCFLESTANKSLYVLSTKKTFFYKESIVYPLVQASSSKKGYVITNNELL